jgi:short-subunit dehydrogenase
MKLDFAGNKLIVIGGTSGIGKAVASLVLSNGGSAVLVGRREAKTREATLELGSRGEVSGWTVDITSGTGRASLIGHLNTNHADATLLVNAAGVFAPKPFLEHAEADYDRIKKSTGHFFSSRRVWPKTWSQVSVADRS